MRDRGNREVCRHGRLVGLFLIGLAGFFCRDVSAQFIAVADAPASSENQKNLPGFQISVDDSLATSFSDFERHSKRGDWEKAFRALSEIPAGKRQGMLRAPKGMIVPAGQRIWAAIAELPADGREAFRVFYDAKARNLWKQVGQPGRNPSDDLKTAQQVFEEFFLTSVGDDAANYLGDVAFEQAEFREADRYWKTVLDHHPNTDLGESRIQVKRAIALLKAGRLRTFDAIVNSMKQRSAGQTVIIGGENVDPVRFLSSLRETEQTSTASIASDTSEVSLDLNGPLPDDTQTSWRLQYVSDSGIEQLNNAVNNNYYYRNGMETWIPPFATAGDRLFCNWFGIVFALDASTGKLLWRSEKFDKIYGQFSQMPHSSANLEQYAVAASEDTVVSIWLNPERMNYWNEPFRMIAYDAKTGKEKWNSEKVSALKEFSFVGTPLIQDGDVLVVCHKRNESKLQIKQLKLADGSEAWSTDLGTAQKTTNSRGREVMPLPQIKKDGATLLVLTNNGALLSFDLRKKELNWALKYGTVAGGNSNGVFYSGEVATSTLLHSYGVLIEHDGILYAKEAAGSVIHAIDPSGPSLLWSRPIASEAVLVGVDDDLLYVLSKELMAIDRESQELVWARRLPIEGGGLSAVIGDGTIYVCSTRGIYCLSKDDGRTQNIFRGEDLGAIGAWIDVVAGRLISITNTAVTAYRLPSNESDSSDKSTNATNEAVSSRES